MIEVMIPLIREAYQSLGIQTEFIVKPSNRNLLEVADNAVDGDVAHMRIVLNGFDNMLAIEPPLLTGIFTLLCQPELPCDPAVLSDPQQTIVTTSVSKIALLQGYRVAIRSQFYVVNDLAVIPTLVSSGRFRYAIYPSSAAELKSLNPQTLRYVQLFSAPLYHVLHKKHALLATDISAALQQTLAKRRKS